MKYRYFKQEGPGTRADIEEYKASKAPIHEARRQLAEDYGADDVLVGLRSGGVKGLLYRADPGEIKGLKIEKTAFHDNGQIAEAWAGTPNRRFKAGKQLAQRIESIFFLTQEIGGHFSDFFVRKYKVDRTVCGRCTGGMAMYSTAAGYAKDLIVFRVPLGDEDDADGQDPFPTIPEQFTEIKKSEWVALTEE